jgi:hypothetical protein
VGELIFSSDPVIFTDKGRVETKQTRKIFEDLGSCRRMICCARNLASKNGLSCGNSKELETLVKGCNGQFSMLYGSGDEDTSSQYTILQEALTFPSYLSHLSQTNQCTR